MKMYDIGKASVAILKYRCSLEKLLYLSRKHNSCLILLSIFRKVLKYNIYNSQDLVSFFPSVLYASLVKIISYLF